MRFTALALAAISTFLSVAALGTVSRDLTDNPAHAFEKRQGVVAVACANVDVNVPRTVNGLCGLAALSGPCNAALTSTATRATLGLLITALQVAPNPIVNTCLCVDVNGNLTPTSLANLRAVLGLELSNIAGINNLLQQILPGLDLAAIAGPIAAQLVPQTAAGCNYPENSTPACTGIACDFVCNNPAFPQKCNRSCLAETAECATAVSIGRRRTVSNDFLCEDGRSACALPGNKFGFECIDTKNSVDSCGGCAFPLPGALAGQDCATLPNIANVNCVAGKCVIASCARGYVLDHNECIEKSTLLAMVDDAAHAAGGLAHLVADRLLVQDAKRIVAERQVSAGSIRANAKARRASKRAPVFKTN